MCSVHKVYGQGMDAHFRRSPQPKDQKKEKKEKREMGGYQGKIRGKKK